MEKLTIPASPVFLDTLETTSDFFLSKSHQTQYRSALRKYSTNTKLTLLIDATPDKTWKDRYWDTWHCKRVLLQQGKTYKSKLCRRRWCQTCNRIKTAEMTIGYKQPLLDLGALYFVTLTAPTVNERELRSVVKKRIKAFQRIKDNMRKNYGMKLNGMRKLEVTYTKGKYHAHFHFIQQGKEEAQTLLKLWLEQFPSANKHAQNITRIADENSFIELFKYSQKDIVKDHTSAYATHVIYEAIQGLRTIQAYGKLRKVKAPEEAIEEVGVIDYAPITSDIWVYEDSCIDYVNASNELLINTLDIKRKINSFKHNKDDSNNNRKEEEKKGIASNWRENQI